MPVNTPSVEYEANVEKWRRIRDCREGRDAVILAGTKYLPALPGMIANGKEFKDYASRGSFYGAVARTMQALLGMVFQKAPTVEVPTLIEPLLKDISPRGNIPFETFAKQSLDEVLIGRVGILADLPAVESTTLLPYAVLYKPEQIISWKIEQRGSDAMLTRVVLDDAQLEDTAEDEFAQKKTERYRVLRLEPGARGVPLARTGTDQYTVQIYRKKERNPADPNEKDEWIAEPKTVPLRRGAPIPFIPFVFISPTSVGPDVEKPPLLDLADINLGHWRNSVDREHGLHLVALPTPYVSGARIVSDPQDPNKIVLGPNKVWELDIGGQAGMLEFTGEGIAAIKEAMLEKEKQMAMLGARMLEDQPTVEDTATGVSMRHSAEHASLRTITQTGEQGLLKVLKILAWLAGAADDVDKAEVKLELNKDFFRLKATPTEVLAAMQLWQADAISFETLYARLQEGGWMPEGVNLEDEQALIDQAIEKRMSRMPDLNPEPEPGEPPTAPPKKGQRGAK